MTGEEAGGRGANHAGAVLGNITLRMADDLCIESECRCCFETTSSELAELCAKWRRGSWRQRAGPTSCSPSFQVSASNSAVAVAAPRLRCAQLFGDGRSGPAGPEWTMEKATWCGVCH